MPVRRAASALVACVLLAVVPRPAGAQTAAEATAAGGYSFLREIDTAGAAENEYPTGWFVSVGYPAVADRLSFVGEVGGNYRKNLVDERQSLHAFLGGARFALLRSSRLTAFAQMLLGVERFSEPGFSESGTAVQPGAGVDVRLFGRLGARAQGDYRTARQNGATFKEFRVSVGAVVGFGGR